MYKKINTMYVILMCIAFICFQSCRIFRPEQFCAEHYPPVIKDSVTEVISYICEYDTLRVPYNELTFDTTGVIPESIVFHKEIKKNALTGDLTIKNGRLTFKCSEDSLKFVIEKKDKQIEDLIVKTVKEPCSLDHRTHWDYFCRWAILIELIAGAIALIFWIVKIYFKG